MLVDYAVIYESLPTRHELDIQDREWIRLERSRSSCRNGLPVRGVENLQRMVRESVPIFKYRLIGIFNIKILCFSVQRGTVHR